MENYALQRPAYSSSQEDDDAPHLAVDGNDDPDRQVGGSCAVTEAELHPWWSVDMQRTVEVRSVDVTNRKKYGKDVFLVSTPIFETLLS